MKKSENVGLMRLMHDSVRCITENVILIVYKPDSLKKAV